MGWTTPATAVADQIVTAAFWNQQVRDNMKVGRGRSISHKTTSTFIASSSWVSVDTTIDLVLPASSGDYVVAHADFAWGTELEIGYMDCQCVASGNWFSASVDGGTDREGVLGWKTAGVDSALRNGAIPRTLGGSDVSGGFVQLRLKARTSTGAPRNINAAAMHPLTFWAHDLGPSV